ncbi:nucleoside triphosphate pyrophosphohydrolase [Salinimonas lutimaris]|uniref:nucleoside triphosphate pyrophosphohydrolase n=1 Tax=Salinimonas lutimaris TaxID=914153 RepID=UPI0010C0FAD8|nr:nucleoside triphosphate pyrophosphohydrolase [Salinimonas lutimaris]
MARLRDPQSGCPWDAKQTMSSLTRYTIEEAYEVVDAIEQGQLPAIRDELGDLLFQVVFYSQIASEQGHFDFADVAGAISDKMARRHPHVFGDANVNESDLSAQWEAIKASEKGPQKTSLLADVPAGLPALMHAQKLQKKCATVGFDWPHVRPVLDKVKEEVEEIQQELDATTIDTARVEEEIGDALFAMVNLARHCQVDADSALRRASHKFAGRFTQVEQLAAARGQSLQTMTLEQMEVLWQQVKTSD